LAGDVLASIAACRAAKSDVHEPMSGASVIENGEV
jgi:hypothetical protein